MSFNVDAAFTSDSPADAEPPRASETAVPAMLPLHAYSGFLNAAYGQNFVSPFQEPLFFQVWNHMRNYFPRLGQQNQQEPEEEIDTTSRVRIKTELNELGESSENDVSDEGRCDDDDDSVGSAGGGSRAQYVSANCVVFTHYTGDVASVVDQHFSRALSYSQDKASPGCDKECSPMSARNFPPSFWNQSSVSVSHSHSHSELYGDSMYHGASAHTAADPWHSHYQQYTAAAHHHRAVHDYHHHHHQHMAGYGGLLLPPSSRLPPHPQYPKAVEWNHRLHHDQPAHHLDPASSYASYPTMAGLDASVQEPSKDLYWF